MVQSLKPNRHELEFKCVRFFISITFVQLFLVPLSLALVIVIFVGSSLKAAFPKSGFLHTSVASNHYTLYIVL